jgi:pimeloyl-ACP methyl ester carboxylesterase
MREPRTEAVVLVHGLWMRGVAMFAMRRRLQRCGYAVHVFSYPSIRCDLRENAERLARRIASIDAATVHIVAHSLGGLVAIVAAQAAAPRGRMVFLGTPFADSYSGRRLHGSRFGRPLLGRCIADWLAHRPRLERGDLEIGVIAGTGGIGMGRVIAPGLAKPNDGVVAVAETAIPGMRDRAVLPVSHSAMLFSPAVVREICAFLAHGRFEHPGANA